MKKASFLSKIWLVLILIAVIIALIHAVNIILYSKNVEYKIVDFYSDKLTSENENYEIVFITDTHQIPGTHLKQIVEEINTGFDADLVVLGGDFPNFNATYRTMDILSKLENKDGIYGVEGNHDNRAEMIDAMQTSGIIPLMNEGVTVRENIFVAGVEDLWFGNPDVNKATADANKKDFVLLLSHNPDLVMKQDMANVDLTLSGHTHGGHMVLGGVWAPALSGIGNITDYGQRFRSGLCYNDDGKPVYVSNGTGYYGNYAPRMFARPQVIIIRLKAE